MQLWNVNLLAYRLRQNEVSQKEQFFYLLLNIVLYSFSSASYINHSITPDPNAYDVYIDIVAMVSALTSLFLAWRANGERYGEKFIERYICLSIPICVRAVVLAIILGAALELTLQPPREETETAYTDVIAICLTVIYVLNCYYIKMQIAAGKRDTFK